MSTRDLRKIAFRGTTNRDLQKHIDSYFTTLGGINPEGLNYTSLNFYYFIDSYGKIIRAHTLPVGYIERKPGDYFKDSLGGIKNERKFAFLGSGYPEIQEAIINFFVKLGATNRQKLLCRYEDMYYFIDETNNIDNSLVLPEGYIHQLETYLNIMKNQEDKIPEYVECVDYFSEKYKGKIYNTVTDKSEAPSTLSWEGILIEMGRLADGSFKVSTKEAYDAQNTYLKAAEYIPQVGDYVVMEKAGGWGYSPDNNGCVAIVNRVEKSRIVRNEVFSIWGEVINPNNSRSVKFSDIPQFGYDKEVIFRKALPYEIPINTSQEKPQQVEEWSIGTYAVAVKGYFGILSGLNKNDKLSIGSIFTIIGNSETNNSVGVKEAIYWIYKKNLKWFATYEEAENFSIKIKENSTFPGVPENTFPVKAIQKQIKKNKFQEVHEIKTVEEKLLKKTKSKLFNI